MHCFLPMMAVPVVAVGKPRALLCDESGYESDWQWLPLARGQRYRDYLMREYATESRVWRPPDHRLSGVCIRGDEFKRGTRLGHVIRHQLQGKLAERH